MLSFYSRFKKIPYVSVFAITTSTAAGLYVTRKYFAGGKCRCPERIDGKTVIITGGEGGIGKETVRALASRGARVILAGPNLDIAKEVAEELKASTKNPQIEAVYLNLAKFSSVRSFVKEFLSSESRLDILINNAGVLYAPRSITEDGNEVTFQTNYLGHFLLTMLLLDCLKEFAPTRIINVSSMAYKGCSGIEFDDLLAEKNFDLRKAYDHSKFAQVMFTRTLAQKLKDTGVTVNALHPGCVDTPIYKNYPKLNHHIGKIVTKPLMKLFFKTPAEGAQTTLHCAISSQCEETTGYYFRDCAIEPIVPHALDDVAANRLWMESLKLVGLPQQ